ncbi:MAG: hypothetical protein ABWW69_02320 [Pyrodictiaceae archaeon]
MASLQLSIEGLDALIAENTSPSLEASSKTLFPSFAKDVYRVVDVIIAGSELRGLQVEYLAMNIDLASSLPTAWVFIVSEKGIVVLLARPEISVEDIELTLNKTEELATTLSREVEIVPAVAGYSIDYDAERYARSIDVPVFQLGMA